MQRPRGMALLSNLPGASDIVRIDAPLMVIIADSEPELNAIGSEAAHNARYAAGSTLYIADSAEHALFDIRDGSVD
jgi:translation initiation factor 2B subunit (eIF-2B alpha/beta/delta family)